MNVFTKILLGDEAKANRLGCPLWGSDNLRRAQRMYEMTGGKGFRVYPKGPKLSKGGKTRHELEAPGKAIFERNLAAEVAFRSAHANKPGWGIRRISAAIENRLHLKSA